MKKGYRSDTNSVFIITCDNLGEYFAEFTRYRKSLDESDENDKSLMKTMYSERSRGFWEDETNNKIIDLLQKDYDNVLGGRDGRIELTFPVNLESSE